MPASHHPSTTFGIVRGISYGLFGPPDDWVAQARELGATLIRVYLYWSQVEPERGEYDWAVVDRLAAQLEPTDHVWVTVCSSSPWATRVSTDFQPQSPALDDDAYEQFVGALVRRLVGRVDYWQCNNEPSNTDLLWSGDAAEYAHQLGCFARAVREADPSALVVLGGCGYDTLSTPEDSAARRFYETLAKTSGDDFDRFSLNLYGDPYRIPGCIAWARRIMEANGYEHPIVVGEYNGPTLFEFGDATAVLEATMTAAFIGLGSSSAPMGTTELAAQIAAESPDRRALRHLYRMSDRLPPSLRMFMHDAPDELVAKRHRIARRQLVQRATLIRASEVDTLVCWNLAPEVGDYADPLNIMDLMFGTLALMGYRDGGIAERRPEADTHRLVVEQLTDARAVEPVESVEPAESRARAMAFRVDHGPDGESVVAWLKTDDALQEDREWLRVSIPWPHGQPEAVDAFGEAHQTVWNESEQTVSLELTATPLFVAPRSVARRAGRHAAEPTQSSRSFSAPSQGSPSQKGQLPLVAAPATSET